MGGWGGSSGLRVSQLSPSRLSSPSHTRTRSPWPSPAPPRPPTSCGPPPWRVSCLPGEKEERARASTQERKTGAARAVAALDRWPLVFFCASRFFLLCPIGGPRPRTPPLAAASACPFPALGLAHWSLCVGPRRRFTAPCLPTSSLLTLFQSTAPPFSLSLVSPRRGGVRPRRPPDHPRPRPLPDRPRPQDRRPGHPVHRDDGAQDRDRGGR